MKNVKKVALVGSLLSLLAVASWYIIHYHTPIRQKTIDTDQFGALSVAYPLFGQNQQVLAFVDTKKIRAGKLAARIARFGAQAVIVDAERMIKNSSTGTTQCLDPKQVAASIETLAEKISMSGDKPLIVSGIDDGAIIPFLNAEAVADRNITNLSIGFSATLPSSLSLCPPFLTQLQEQQRVLTSSPPLAGNWRSVWNDQPNPETADFVQGIAKTSTWIALYNTPVETVLIEELQKLFFHTDNSPPSTLPIVELPVKNDNETVTIFYSGDGGWRDLDRVIGKSMAKQGWPVVGIDCLRGFWSGKTAEQATKELAGAMEYYRQNWGAKNFVLAGYSFGADILPPIYNRLSSSDQQSVRLLVLLTPSRDIDFAIHISEWLGKKNKALPMAPEMERLPKSKILCIYGQEEQAETSCADIAHTKASLIELPGDHHFDKDYQKLTRLILEHYPTTDAHGDTPQTHPQ